MGKEDAKNRIKELFKKVSSKEDKEREETHPHVIYQLESSSSIDLELALAAFSAMTAEQFSLAIETKATPNNNIVTVRTRSDNMQTQRSEGALFLGLKEATGRIIDQTNSTQQTVNLANTQEATYHIAKTLLNNLISNQELFDAFKEFYGGLRWSSDQEGLTRALFTHGSDFDSEFLDQNLRGNKLRYFIIKMYNLPYGEWKNLDNLEPAELLAKYPNLDYHNLQDEDIKREYAKLCGEILADQYRKHERNTKPSIPLSRHPIIEALVINEVAVDRPKQKYDFGASDLTDIILNCDSQPAHEALIKAINTRLPKGQRYVFDGPNEFQFKARLINHLLRAYRQSPDEYHHLLLKQDVLDVLDAYSRNGEIANSVRAEDEEKRSRYPEQYYNSDIGNVKEIVKDILVTCLASADSDVLARAEGLISQYIPNSDQELSEYNPLVLSRADLILVLLDALQEVNLFSHPDTFERIGTKLFTNNTIGEMFGELANLRLRAISIQSDKPRQEAENIKNAFLLAELQNLAKSEQLNSKNYETVTLFNGFVKRVQFNAYHMTNLPQEYSTLLDLAQNSNIREEQKNTILWHINKQFEYVDSQVAYLLVPVILDMLQVALGSPDNVRFPTAYTSSGVGAIMSLVEKHGNAIFKAASHSQLETMAKYHQAIENYFQQITPETSQEESSQNLQNVLRYLQLISEHYEEFLHIEAVKIHPHIYYPWVVKQISPFWQKMQWEVGRGQSPSVDMKELYRALQYHIKNSLSVQKNYPEDFDCLENGGLDALLLDCWSKMVCNHNIQYNQTVWIEGLGFMLNAIRFMPTAVLAQFQAKYPQTAFLEYLEQEHTRWQLND